MEACFISGICTCTPLLARKLRRNTLFHMYARFKTVPHAAGGQRPNPKMYTARIQRVRVVGLIHSLFLRLIL